MAPAARSAICATIYPPPAVENAGVEGEVIVQKLLGQPFEVGYNAMYDRIENLIEVR